MRHLLLYDGECGLCQASVRFVTAHDRRARFHFAALQSDTAAARLAPLGGRPSGLDTLYVIEDAWGPGPRLRERSDAALFVAKELGWPWRAASVFRVLPRSWRDALYDLVARHRRSLFGGASACARR